MYNIIFIFIFVLGQTWGTGNKDLNKGKGSSNTEYNQFVYNSTDIPNPLTQFEGYNSFIPSQFDNSLTYQGEGSSTHYGQYNNQGIPSEQQINTSSSTHLRESAFRNVLPSVIVPPSFSASNNVAQSSLPNLSTTNNQNVDHSTQYPYNFNNISPYYVGGSSTSAVQNNNFQRGIPQSEQLNSLPNLDELGDIFRTKPSISYTHKDVQGQSSLQGNEFSNLNYQQLNQEETLPNVETSNTQVLNDNWLREEHHVTKLSNGKYYNCNACNTKFLFVREHINSPKHLQYLNWLEIIKNPETRQEHIDRLCNENYIIKIKTTKYKCMPCNGQNILRAQRLLPHVLLKQHQDNLIKYGKKLEKGETQHSNNDSSDEDEDWKVKAETNYIIFDSNGKYFCRVCNKHITNVKQNVIGHIASATHKKNIQKKEEKDLEQGLNLFNQEMYGNQPQIGESSMQGNTLNKSDKGKGKI